MKIVYTIYHKQNLTEKYLTVSADYNRLYM